MFAWKSTQDHDGPVPAFCQRQGGSGSGIGAGRQALQHDQPLEVFDPYEHAH